MCKNKSNMLMCCNNRICIKTINKYKSDYNLVESNKIQCSFEIDKRQYNKLCIKRLGIDTSTQY